MHGKAERVACSAQTQNTPVTGPKFTKFLSDVELSSAILIRVFLLRFRCGMPAHNKGGVCQISQIRAKNQLKYQPRLSDHKKKVGLIMPTHVYQFRKYDKIGPVYCHYSVSVFSFSLFFVYVPCVSLSWPRRQLLSARKYNVTGMWRVGAAVWRWTCDLQVVGSIPGR